MSVDLFSVWQFFTDGSYERVRWRVDAAEAVKAYHHYTTSVGAQLGTTVRVIIVDDGDCINMEWQFGKGRTFPSDEEMAAFVHREH